MARSLRIEFPGATYHITSRGNERRRIFHNAVDRRVFLQILGETAHRFGWSVAAWVLMTNHFHLVVQTPQPNLSRGMHWLNGRYAAWFNSRHQRVGHLFQGRFHSVLIEKETYFTEVLRYVVLNPVRAGMVDRPEDYRWSSYRVTAGFDDGVPWFDSGAALEPFAIDRQTAQSHYREFVLVKAGLKDDLWNGLRNGIFLGTEGWAKTIRRQVESRPRSTDHPKRQRAVGRPNMSAICDMVARVSRTSIDTIRSRRGCRTRALIAWIGWHEGLVTLRSIAASLRLRSEGHISNLIRRCERWFCLDQGLLDQADAALALLRA